MMGAPGAYAGGSGWLPAVVSGMGEDADGTTAATWRSNPWLVTSYRVTPTMNGTSSSMTEKPTRFWRKIKFFDRFFEWLFKRTKETIA